MIEDLLFAEFTQTSGSFSSRSPPVVRGMISLIVNGGNN